MNAITCLLITCLALSVHGSPSPQIVGGNNALDGFHPYQVSLRAESSSPDSHFCSGVIISEYFILTAAQCLHGKTDDPFQIYAVVGSNNLDAGITYKARYAIIHAGYNKVLNMNNIGLVLVDTAIVFDQNVQTIALPTEDINYDNYPLIATGWGKLCTDGPLSNELQVITLKGYINEDCGFPNDIKRTHICTLAMTDQGLCQGDAGGPLVANGYLAGLISFNDDHLCNTGGPNESTKIFPYKSWIKYYTGVE